MTGWKPPRVKTFHHFKNDKGRASKALLCPDKKHVGGQYLPEQPQEQQQKTP